MTSTERLADLAQTEWEFVRAAVASHPNVSRATLASLTPTGAAPADNAIAVAIAHRTEATPEALRQLSRRFLEQADWHGRPDNFQLGLALLDNPSTPDDAIAQLTDPDRTSRHFRERAASTVRVPKVIDQLAADVSERVRRRAERTKASLCAAVS